MASAMQMTSDSSVAESAASAPFLSLTAWVVAYTEIKLMHSRQAVKLERGIPFMSEQKWEPFL